MSRTWCRWLRQTVVGPKNNRARPIRPTKRLRLEPLEDRTVPTAGALDPTFGTGGKADFDITNASALEPDGKIVLARDTFALARFRVNGTLDTDFGVGGSTEAPPFNNLTPYAVATQPDSKIVVIGQAYGAPGGDSDVVARYTADGALDPTFGSEGYVSTVIGIGSVAYAVAIQPDGKIIVAGGCGVADDSSKSLFALARYNPDGSLDASFGTGGIVTTDVSNGTALAKGLAVQPDGKIVVVGLTDAVSTGSTAILVRYLPNGSLDPSFGTGGKAIPSLPGFSYGAARAVALQPDGRIVAGGVYLNDSSQFSDIVMFRYRPDGTPDPLFGSGGHVTVDLGSYDYIYCLALQPDGRIVAAGAGGDPRGEHVIRLNTDGSRDQSFGTNGTVYPVLPATGSYNMVLVQPDGKIVATGTDNLARLLPGGSIVVSPATAVTTSEAGGSAQFSVVLSQVPTANVTVSLTPSVPGEASLDKATLTFTPANALTPQTVTVTGLDDPYDDGDVTFTIRVGAASSADSEFNNVRGRDVIVTNADNDTAGILVTPTSGLVTNEAGGPPQQFTIQLTCSPRSPVTVNLRSSSPTDGNPTVSSVTFLPTDPLTPKTVTVVGVDDQVDDGHVLYTIITDPAVSTDPAFSGLNPADVRVLSVNNDYAGIEVTPTAGLTTTESGGTAQFTVRLLTIPRAPVTIGLTSTRTAEGTVSPSSLVFAADASALSPKTVTITGVNDTIVDGDISYTIVTAAATSTDPKYAGLNPPDVAVVNRDNDAAGFVVTPTAGLVTTEAGGGAQFAVRLLTVPTANVTMALTSSAPTEGTVAPASLTFTPANALTPQTVTVTGVNDGEVDGPIAYSVVTGVAVSGDLNYNGLNPPDVAVTNQDNDPIRVGGVVLNGGAAQRSMLKGITVTFSQVVTIATGAFTVRRSSDAATVGLIVTPTVADGRTIVALTFTGPDVIGGSLADGNYTLTITGALVTDETGQPLDGDGDGNPGGDYVLPPSAGLYRLFGDATGDRTVNVADLTLFRSAYGTAAGGVGFNAAFDFDGDGVINATDLNEFRGRFGITL
jgi:uncharacterized delta-60 repeat protein